MRGVRSLLSTVLAVSLYGCSAGVPERIGVYDIRGVKDMIKGYANDKARKFGDALEHVLRVVDDGDKVITPMEAAGAIQHLEPHLERFYKDVLALKAQDDTATYSRSTSKSQNP